MVNGSGRQGSLGNLIKGYCGPGNQFSSQRHLAHEAGLSANVVTNVISSNTAHPKTLRKLASALGIDSFLLFSAAGWVVGPEISDLSPDERFLIDRWRELKDAPAVQNALLAAIEGATHAVVAKSKPQAVLSGTLAQTEEV